MKNNLTVVTESIKEGAKVISTQVGRCSIGLQAKNILGGLTIDLLQDTTTTPMIMRETPWINFDFGNIRYQANINEFVKALGILQKLTKMESNNNLPFAERCDCGAITVTVLATSFNIESASLPESEYITKFSMIKLEDIKTSECNYCKNKQGTDLCGCGSGEKFEQCSEGLPECSQSSQVAPKDFFVPAEYQSYQVGSK